MLAALELENFKAFGQRVRIPFAPITLLFGENSAGKSSILQALNLLKQTRESRDSGALLLPRSESGIVDLGSFQELIFDHDLSRKLTIRIDIGTVDTRTENQSFIAPVFRSDSEKDDTGVEIRFSRPSISHEVQLDSATVYNCRSSEPIMTLQPRLVVGDESKIARRYLTYLGLRRRRGQAQQESSLYVGECTQVTGDPEWWKDLYAETVERKDVIIDWLLKMREETTEPKTHQSKFLFVFEDDDGKTHDLGPDITQAIAFYRCEPTLEAFIGRMKRAFIGSKMGFDGFLPAGREYRIILPEELFDERQQNGRWARSSNFDLFRVTSNIGRRVDSALRSLFPLGPFRRPPQRWYVFTGTSPQDVGYSGDLLPDLLYRREDILKETNEWLQRLGIKYQLVLESLNKRNSDLFELRLKDMQRAGGVEICLPDVGFGISQLLPFIVQSLATENQTISIEQPEVHIHPRLQADLGDLLAEAIKGPRYNQFLIETHSEHLILRLQKLIRKKVIRPSDLSVLYIKRGSTGSSVLPLRLDEDGDFIDEWPEGFFPERLRELED